MNNTKTEIHKLIGEGSYGCIYSPNFSCMGDNVDSEYISKIQILNNMEFTQFNIINSDDEFNEMNLMVGIIRETYFGKFITNIDSYYEYFAPIIKSCQVDINILQNIEKNKCHLFRDNITNYDKDEKKYISSKITFIYGPKLNVVFNKLIDEKKNNLIINEQIIKTFYHLMKGLKLLNNSIIHYDLKNDNIIFDKKRGIPIIIDFGLSFNVSSLLNAETPQQLENIFYIYYNKYLPWCFEISVLSYIVQNILFDNENKIKTDINSEINIKEINKLKSVIYYDFIKKKVLDPFVGNILSTGDINKMHKNIEDYFDYWINNNGDGDGDGDGIINKTWKELINDLKQYYMSWDVYSVCICYLEYLKKCKLIYRENENSEDYIIDDTLDDFYIILKETILFIPTVGKDNIKRKSAFDLVSILENIKF